MDKKILDWLNQIGQRMTPKKLAIKTLLSLLTRYLQNKIKWLMLSTGEPIYLNPETVADVVNKFRQVSVNGTVWWREGIIIVWIVTVWGLRV